MEFDIKESTAYWTGYNAGVKDTIDNACEWLKVYAHFSITETMGSFDEKDLIDRFRKAMDE